MAEDDFQKRFLEANANVDFIGYQFARLIRYVVRASVSQDPYETNKHNAAQTMKFMFELIAASKDRLHTSELVDAAVSDLKVDDEDDERDGLLRVATEGVKYMLELSSTDNAARGRQSKQRSNLEGAIQFHVQRAGVRRFRS
ncbi:MAG: hypothetical protein ACOYB4_02030 [Methyloceanibacter sp.]